MNSTIIRKKRKLDCGCYDFAFSKNRCKQHATIESTNKRIEKHEEGIEQESWINLRDDLDAVYSKWLRISNSNSEGICECYTCGKKQHYSEAQCGHFVSRSNMATRFMPQNTKIQCVSCNEYKDGNIEAFEFNLERDNNGIVDWLREQGRSIAKPSVSDLKELLNEYRYKLKIAQSKFKK
jgi:hypothetical protein